jgi:putative ABC transport system permease protein
MFKNYFKICLRNIIRNKTYSIINILGLSTGIACSLIILFWIADELSYDRFHENADEIYRVVGDDAIVGKMVPTCGPLAEYLINNFPEVINATRYMTYSGSAFKYDDKVLTIEIGAFADPAFFEIFSFTFLSGDPKKALSENTNIVITESMAEKFFGDENPLGKTLLVDGQSPVVVSAVLKNPSANSHLRFDFILNTVVLKYIGFPLDSWSNASFNTFIQVPQNADVQTLDKSISGVMANQIPGFNRKLHLQPLKDIHLNTDYAYDYAGLGDKKYIYIFFVIALFLITIAAINYINLTTAGLLKRSREVGLRKVMGSNRLQVIKQLFIESFIIVVIAFFAAFVLIEIFLPLFNQVSGKVLDINYFDMKFIGGIIILLVSISLLAGGYPAFMISSVKPVHAIKNIFIHGQKGSLFRKALVVIQFSLSIMLIIGTITVFYQLNYIGNKILGFEKDNILHFEAKGKFQQDYAAMKNELLNLPSIVDVTAEDRLFTNPTNATVSLYWEGKQDGYDIQVEYSFVDYNYFDMLKVDFSEGRNFSRELRTDDNSFILNEEAVNQMRLDQPIGKRFRLNEIEGSIIGIIKNTNFKSLHLRIEPTAYIALGNSSSTLSFSYNGVILVKTAAGKTSEAITAIEDIWKNVNPNIPFEYHFLDETIDKQYIKEIQTGNIFSYFSLIAIFISCLGIYGLTLFTTEYRTKEIGVRKVLGASVTSIVKMFYNDFSKLILISGIIAIPLAWYAMEKWLQNFAYRINISWWMFALAGGIALAIALATVSFQAIKAASVNPVESLKYE